MPHRILNALQHEWLTKVLIVVIGTSIWEMLKHLGLLYADLLYTDPLLITLVATLLAVDWGTGIVAAARRREKITSRRLRDTARKVLEYAALTGIAIMIANAFQSTPVSIITTALDDATLLYVALTEAVSIVENVSGSRTRAVYYWRQIRRVLKGTQEGEIIIEDIVRTEIGDTPPKEGQEDG